MSKVFVMGGPVLMYGRVGLADLALSGNAP